MRGKRLVLMLAAGLAMAAIAAVGCDSGEGRHAAPAVAVTTPVAVQPAKTTPAAEHPAAGGPIKTEVVKTAAGWELMRGGKPFIVKGVGGDFDKKRLVEIGGNAYRTWGTPSIAELDEAQKLGLGVCVGIWMGNTADAINKALPEVQRIVTRYKDHPAVMMWGIGNEVENAHPDDPALWQALETLAAAAKKIDPNHPTMTVLAEMGAGAKKITMIHQYCPSIDIVGINSYAGAASVPARYREVGGTKPFVLTEYGPPGQWESQRTPWRASFELSSTEKGNLYRKAWTDGIVAAKGLALGGFAFLWGNKNESTVTWYGMMLPDGSNLEPIEALATEWTGKPPANRCPKIKSLKVEGEASVAAGTVIKASVEAVDPENDPLKYEWVLRGDSRDNRYGGGARAETEALANAITKGDGPNVEVKLPAAGPYRLFVYIHDGKGNAAVGNIPLQSN
jgi:hypothetical protein